VPLFSAIEEVLSGYTGKLIMLRDDDMVPAVEEFIASLEKQVKENPHALDRPQLSPSQIRTMREKNLRYWAEFFAKSATSDDLFFLDGVLERWDVYREYPENDRPPSPIMAAFQYEIDERWAFRVDYEHGERVSALVRMLERKDWLADLLKWIANKGTSDDLSPCLIASKAAGMQEAWDKTAA